MDTVLGVESSLTGRRWLRRDGDERIALALSQRLDVPEIVGRVLAGRGVGLDEAEVFLNPTLKALLPDPHRFKDMKAACDRLAAAVTGGERILLFGDYDVDGATSAALLSRFLTAVGGKVRVYVPDRLKEGYGPNAPALLRLKDEGASLAVTVDCGTGAHEALAAAAAAGLDCIVVDHHEAEARLPVALAVVNPNRLDESGYCGELAAVGVAFLVAVGLNRRLREAGWYKRREEPNLLQWLDLVALGTVCDVVPLKGLNRAFVAQGLKVMAGRGNPGLKALADVAGVAEAPGTYHAGFLLGPRINAGGRVGQADLGVRLLTTDDDAQAAEIARRLDQLNRERQEIEAAVLADAQERVAAEGLDRDPVVVVGGDGWHPGVVGIVASRLAEFHNRPACVVALDGEGGTGSGRSVKGIDLGAAVLAARHAGLLSRGGGHAMAAGFALARTNLGPFRDFLADRLGAGLADRPRMPALYLDGGLTAEAADESLIGLLDQAGPFGAGNPEPRFALARVRLSYVARAGENHLRCTLAGERGGKLAAIAFRAFDGDLGAGLMAHDGAPLHVAGRLRLNRWQGRVAPQLLIDDAAPAR
ncbi:MAG: single-stranded-DNA-specific exonuclease RecJ [Magnetospirillum sp. WYHS-4]